MAHWLVGWGGECSGPFRRHLEQVLTDADVAALTGGKSKVRGEGEAKGLPGSKWVTTSEALPPEEKNIRSLRLKGKLAERWAGKHKK